MNSAVSSHFPSNKYAFCLVSRIESNSPNSERASPPLLPKLGRKKRIQLPGDVGSEGSITLTTRFR